MVSCIGEKCIYQWKTLQNSLDYQFRLLTGGGKKNECRSGKQELLCDSRSGANPLYRGQDLWFGTR